MQICKPKNDCTPNTNLSYKFCQPWKILSLIWFHKSMQC
uniref:Uncharacterized protein n=1 Tax=Rhizophora mucronata TaxID=61149 RepID=A0A2P2K000_RHIMU